MVEVLFVNNISGKTSDLYVYVTRINTEVFIQKFPKDWKLYQKQYLRRFIVYNQSERDTSALGRHLRIANNFSA